MTRKDVIPFFTLKHAAFFIGVGDSTVRAWLRKGKIGGHKNELNSYWYFDLREINRVRQEYLLPELSKEEAEELWAKY